MRSATRDALLASRAVLDGLGSKVDLATGEQLLSAGRAIGDSAGLRAALADRAATTDDKRSIVARAFAQLGAPARAVLDEVVAKRWSNPDDLIAAVEELGIRAIAISAPLERLETELFAFGGVVRTDAELELALGSKLATPESRADLVERLLARKATAHTLAIVRHLVRQPRGRRIAQLLRFAAVVVADQSGLAIATVTTARELDDRQLLRLQSALSAQYGRELRVNQVIDPSVLGGLRVQVGDDVIDGSIAAKLNELRLQLAG